MMEKSVSCLLHLLGVHRWEEGRFIDIYNSFFEKRTFPSGRVQNLWMRSFLACKHDQFPEEELLHSGKILAVTNFKSIFIFR